MPDNTIIQFNSLDSDAKTLSISFEYQNVGYTIKFPPPETDISKGHTKKNHISVFFLFRAHIQECLQGSIEGNNQRAKNRNISKLSSKIWKKLPYTFKHEFSKYTNRVNEYRTSKVQNSFTSSDVSKQQSYYQKRAYEDIRHTAYSENVTNYAINNHLKNESSILETTAFTSRMEEPIPLANLSFQHLFQNGHEEYEFGRVKLTHSNVDETLYLNVNTTNSLEDLNSIPSAYYETQSLMNSNACEMHGMESLNINSLNFFKSTPLQLQADFSCQSLVTPNEREVLNTENTLTPDINLVPFWDSYAFDIRSNNFVNSVNHNLYENDWLVYEDTQLNSSFELAIPNRHEVDSTEGISELISLLNISEPAFSHMVDSNGYERAHQHQMLMQGICRTAL
ncbi:13117_t:CDS:1 [Dentiscutata erythropus]|uniref:13117_t:CDS:1 n=1 Tax=Dentiscutata erythropus TaxID=1348616 RepID=A0A9N9ALC4_9GLOM|nr:13117_t:CDS:1 [Dentiscutata erythropus]